MFDTFCKKAHDFIWRNPEQDAFLNLMIGAIRSGKTGAMIPKTIFQLCPYKVPGEKVITGVSKDTIYHNVLNDIFECVGPSNYRFNRNTGELYLLNSKWRVVGAKDEGSEKYIRGSTIGVCVSDETSLMPESFFKMLIGRMSPDGARFYGTSNPDVPSHYLKVDYIDNADLLARGDLWVENFTLDDNPGLSEKKKEQYRRMYTGVFYQRYIEGRWVIAEGAIYRDALGDQCSFDETTRPLGLYSAYGARYIGVDYGTTNPCVFLDVYDDGKVMWQDNEYYWDSKKEMKQKTDAEYADELVKFIGPDKRGLTIVMDPSAASFRVECIKRGLPVKEAVNDVLDGIRRTSSALKTGRYKINRKKCPKTWSEAESYAWDDKKAAKGEEEPIKMRDHTCDAKRYVVHTMMPSWRVA